MKAFSVIIPNLNSLLIRDVLEALKHQTVSVSDAEILVVGWDDPGLVIEDELVRFFPTTRHTNAAINRNVGIANAKGEILLFLDADCIPMSDWIEHHLHQQEQGNKVVGGAITFGTRNYFQLADNVSSFHEWLPFTREGARPYLATANLSVHRTVIEKAGLMKTHLNYAHDLEWTVRFRSLGYTLYFEPRAIVFHDPPRYNLSAVWKHWTSNAPDTLRVKLFYSYLLNTPALAQYRSLLLWGALLIAAWATIRTFGHPRTLLQYWYTLPLVYLTKIAWCLGAYRKFPYGWEDT